MALVVQRMIPSADLIAGNINAKQRSIIHSSAWWWSQISLHALQKVISVGLFIRKEAPLQDKND